ncbi:hypothetical protein, partial [Mesorhizobium sp.]|uniref:hypothetical protein n=1 Tax=Mesorhizobium sp. TaxID=1871066 RepID=UPI00338E2E77
SRCRRQLAVRANRTAEARFRHDHTSRPAGKPGPDGTQGASGREGRRDRPGVSRISRISVARRVPARARPSRTCRLR